MHVLTQTGRRNARSTCAAAYLGLADGVHGVLDRELFQRRRRVAAAAFSDAWRRDEIIGLDIS